MRRGLDKTDQKTVSWVLSRRCFLETVLIWNIWMAKHVAAAQRPASSPQSSSPGNSHDVQDDGCKSLDCLNHDDKRSSILCHLPRTSGVDDGRAELASWRRDGLFSDTYYISYSYYHFLVISNIGSIPPQDYQFLELQGCLDVLQPPILDQFVRQYFLYMHPMLPILDESAFWDVYKQRGIPCRPHKISLLLFQAMMFACCSSILSLLGQKTARAARATFYRRAQLLFNLETESSSIIRSQAALLLASWSFSSYDIPRKPNVPWLSIAIQHARDAEAHNYKAFDPESEEHAVRKRLWWCCIIRDRIFGLSMRRGILITTSPVGVESSSRLGYHDLVGECHRSFVYDADTKIRLAEILDLLVELCIILTDILNLVFPIEDCLKPDGSFIESLDRIQSCRLALDRWHGQAVVRLLNTDTSPASLERHDSVILFSNLVDMYYYSTKVALGHHEILQIATHAMVSTTSPSDIFTLQDSYFELQEATVGTTECLEKLIHLSLVRWLPITAVSCTALPLLLHLLGVEGIPMSNERASASQSDLMRHRLDVLKKAMETYQLQYEGVSWITDAINHIMGLARSGSMLSIAKPEIGQSEGSGIVDNWIGVLTFQPVWYSRLALTIDVAFSKGRLPEPRVFLPDRSFREVIMAEIGLPISAGDSADADQTARPENGEDADLGQPATSSEEKTDQNHVPDDPLGLDSEQNALSVGHGSQYARGLERIRERRTKHWVGAGIIDTSMADRSDTQTSHEPIVVRQTRAPTPPSSSVAPGPTLASAQHPPHEASQDAAVSDLEFTFLHDSTWQAPVPASAPQEQAVPPDNNNNNNNNTSSHCPPMDLDSISGVFAQASHDTGQALKTPPGSNVIQDESLLDRILGGSDRELSRDSAPAVWMRVSDGDEYTGPSSGIVAISDPGLQWVRRNVTDSDAICETMREIRDGVLNHLRHPNWMTKVYSLSSTAPSNLDDIPPSDIQRYVDAYFSDVQILFPVLDRPTFLAQLSTLGTSSDGQSYSWMALLNAVLACGCRAALSDETADAFKASGCEAWRYFKNALSYEMLIAHVSTDLLAVQAVAVMTVFAQGLSCPQRLEWTLSSMASRLAQALALHRHPAPEWNLSEDEKQERNRVFWVIYCLDKTIALRSGRPSVICDDDISCCFPRRVEINQRGEDAMPVESPPRPSSFDFFLCLTRLARICGDVSRRLYSANALYKPASQLLTTLDQILQDLESWLQMIPALLLPGKPMVRMSDRCGLTRCQIISFQTSYYYVLCAAYRRFMPLFTGQDKSLEHLVDRRSHVSHIRAARSSKSASLRPAVLGWASAPSASRSVLLLYLTEPSLTSSRLNRLVFYYPLTSLITIFVHTVSNPPSELTDRDIALMEILVGVFGRLEYVTAGQTAFTKTTEFVRLARGVIATHRSNDAGSHRNNISPATSYAFRNSITNAERVLPTRPGAEDEQVERWESQADNLVHSHHRSNPTPMMGTNSMARILSPEAGPHGGAQRPGPVVNSHGMDVATINQNQALDKDLLSILALSPDDMQPSHWLSDWLSTS
ncbi:hypothetical protein F66182_6600 [Fusarium sp. NRRL 66182]|nr:hypothetical protein F66182_6600 [Fusarium sp. NRRL 66182]